jgi:hypothetical protein
VIHEDVEVVPRGTADERHEVRGTVARRDASDEHPVFPAQGYLLHQLLGLVVVDRHQPVVEIDEQVFELIAQVGQRLPEGLLGHHVGDGLAGEILLHPCPDRPSLGMPKVLPFSRRE